MTSSYQGAHVKTHELTASLGESVQVTSSRKGAHVKTVEFTSPLEGALSNYELLQRSPLGNTKMHKSP